MNEMDGWFYFLYLCDFDALWKELAWLVLETILVIVAVSFNISCNIKVSP